MLEASLILLIGIALVVVYFNVKGRATKAVQELKQTLIAQKPRAEEQSAAARNWRSAKGLLAGAERALDERQWDKAEELCELAFSILDLSSRSSTRSSAQVPRSNRTAFAAPARSLKQQRHAWRSAGCS